MISGDAAEREEREDETERVKPNGTQPAPDKIEEAPLGALSQENANDKRREEAPLSLTETKSSPQDKCAPSQQEHIQSIEVTSMNSQKESKTRINLEEDKMDSALPPCYKRAQDKVEEEGENNIPPPTLQKEP